MVSGVVITHWISKENLFIMAFLYLLISLRLTDLTSSDPSSDPSLDRSVEVQRVCQGDLGSTRLTRWGEGQRRDEVRTQSPSHLSHLRERTSLYFSHIRKISQVFLLLMRMYLGVGCVIGVYTRAVAGRAPKVASPDPSGRQDPGAVAGLVWGGSAGWKGVRRDTSLHLQHLGGCGPSAVKRTCEEVTDEDVFVSRREGTLSPSEDSHTDRSFGEECGEVLAP